MLQIAYIRENRQEIIDRLNKRNLPAEELVQKALELDESRRKLQTQLDQLQFEMNTVSKEIGDLMKSGKKEDAEAARQKTGDLKAQIKTLQEQAETADEALNQHLYSIPNAPHAQVAAGRTPEENVEVARKGEIPTLFEGALPHWELTAKYNLVDFELGNKITGAGFPVYVNRGARIQRAMVNFFLDRNTAAGYTEYQPPLMVNAASGFGTGQLPDKEGQMYFMNEDELYMIPTSEVPITNIYRDEILEASELPKKMTAYTPCFRREAGSYGKDVRGLNRLHQFDKVEIVQIQHPDKSYEALEDMVKHVAGLLEELELPYRILRLCGGDMGFASAMTYDFEVYSTAQQKWLEVSSVSNFETFQANRLKLRYREGSDKPKLAHTLNGSSLAFPRVLAALLENHQTPTGIVLPAALAKYAGFDRID